SVQALYGLLQFAVDNGSALEGARRAAAGTLDARGRASIVRLRLQLAVAGAAAMLGISAIAGSRAVAAASTYALAVVLFALLRYWEPFGRGSSEPWASYIVLRSAAPALAAAACLVASTRFPLPLAGAAECAAIVGVALAFSLTPLRDLTAAVRADRGPWLEAAAIGLPSLVWQVALAAGVVLAGLAGAAATSGVVAVGMRLVTGLMQLSGVISTSLFPALARTGQRVSATYENGK